MRGSFGVRERPQAPLMPAGGPYRWSNFGVSHFPLVTLPWATRSARWRLSLSGSLIGDVDSAPEVAEVQSPEEQEENHDQQNVHKQNHLFRIGFSDAFAQRELPHPVYRRQVCNEGNMATARASRAAGPAEGTTSRKQPPITSLLLRQLDSSAAVSSAAPRRGIG